MKKTPNKRGRPKKADAKSAAERMRACLWRIVVQAATGLYSKAENSSAELVHDDKHPVAFEYQRFVAK